MTDTVPCSLTKKARAPRTGQTRSHLGGRPHVCIEPTGHAPDKPLHRCWCGLCWEEP